jgi:hypothetical protein
MSKVALVVNCSAPHYNLGAAKLADWLRGEGYVVEAHEGDPGLFGGSPDLVCLSVIFSWHAPIALEVARGTPTARCGAAGRACSRSPTGGRSRPGGTVRGLDQRFERQRGDYRMTFASRGCPVGCWFCIVPKLEGLTFTLDWDFTPAPILCDNNLSALPGDFQDHILARYVETGTKLADCNSGFEPKRLHRGDLRAVAPALQGRVALRLRRDRRGGRRASA